MNRTVKRVVTALTSASIVTGALLTLDKFASRTVSFNVILAAMIILVSLVQLEFYQMIARRFAVMTLPGVLAGVVYLAGRFFFQVPNIIVPLFFMIALTALFGKYERPLEAFAHTALGFFYIPWLLGGFIEIPHLHGIMIMLYVIAIIKISDMGGYALGVAMGKHKMCPSISPNKSWEGMAGSILASVIVSCLFIPLTGYALSKAIAFGVAAAVLGTLGDLVESKIKRDCGVKDSATFMPAGLGGFLDMFDSLIFAPALLLPFL